MKAKKILYQVRDARRECQQLEEQLTDCYLNLLPSGIRYDLDKVQSSPSGDAMADAVAYAAKYEQQLRKRIALLNKLRSEAFTLIGMLEDSRHRQILQLYFLSTESGHDYTMQMVADKIGYSRQHTIRLYNEALATIDKLRLNETIQA